MFVAAERHEGRLGDTHASAIFRTNTTSRATTRERAKRLELHFVVEHGALPSRLYSGNAFVRSNRMRIDLNRLKPREAYHWLTASVLPRPIAWVSTINAEGRTNLAPFSFFQGVTASPPSLLFIPANTRHGTKKDTLRNLEAVPEFVVNTVPFALAEQMNATSASVPYGESEFEKFGIESAPSELVRPPRVAKAPISFECKVHQIVPVGEGPIAANIVIGLILTMHVAPEVLGADGMPDPAKLDHIGRMGGAGYTMTRERFELERPD